VEFSVSQQTIGTTPVVSVQGEIDVYSAPALKDALSALLETRSSAVVVDLTEVGFLDSTGLGALVAARTSATDAGARLAVVCDRDRILKLFRITGLDGVFDIFPTVDAAVQGLDAPAGPLPSS
jgi:anti-sigma B factor antagonist